MKFSVFSKHQAMLVEPSVPYVFISIMNPGLADNILKTPDTLRGVLNLKFPDIDLTDETYESMKVDPEISLKVKSAVGDRLFGDEAEQIINFALSHTGDCELICVHCHAGVSRSPAVAAALAEIINGDSSPITSLYTGFNRHVYRTIIDRARDMGIIQ